MKSNRHDLIYVRPSEIEPYYRNPRKNEQAILKVAESIQAYGFNQPIVVDKQNTIIVGHTRWKAALKLELDIVPVLQVDLDEAKAKAYRIADNRTGEEAAWDFELLIEELRDLNGEFTGFDQHEVDEFMSMFDPASIDEQGRLDIKEPIKCPECGHEFTP